MGKSEKWQEWMVFGRQYQPPTEILNAVKEGWLVDISWGNDVCPSFAAAVNHPPNDGEKWVRLWSDHPENKEREVHDERSKRFLVVMGTWEEPESCVELLKTDDVTEALDRVRSELTKLKEAV